MTVTGMVRVTVAAGRADEYRARVEEITRRTHAEDDGVVAYRFHQQTASRTAGLVEKMETIGLDDAEYDSVGTGR